MTYRTDPALKITRGDSGEYARFPFTVTVNALPVNVTNRSFFMTGKRSLSDVIPVFQASTDRGDFTYINAATGQMIVALRATDTGAIAAETSLYCDIQMADAAGIVTLDKFMLLVEMDVTEVFT